MIGRGIDRRTILSAAATAVGGAYVFGTGCAEGPPASPPEIDEFVRRHMAKYNIAGVAACIVNDNRMTWSASYGFADLERQIPMSLDGIQNIGSISKTVTTTALMQLWEMGRFHLDDDVSDYTPFPVRNPKHPDLPITFRLLLTHRSSIRDGDWYGRMYQCGDPAVSLTEWIEGYLQPGGRFYDAAENFESWGPGDRWKYNNVAYGLLGYLVQRISGEDFENYCRTRIFQPLEMNETSWYLTEVDVSRHVVPYTYRQGEEVRSPTWGGSALGVIKEGTGPTVPVGDGHHANCVYNHPNFPDGFLRTSVRQLAGFARAYLNGGTLAGTRILEESTIGEMMRSHHMAPDLSQGLTWYSNSEARGHEVWGHAGGDPGINTDIGLVPEEGVAAIVFMNTWGGRPAEITGHLVQQADSV